MPEDTKLQNSPENPAPPVYDGAIDFSDPPPAAPRPDGYQRKHFNPSDIPPELRPEPERRGW